MSEQGEKTCPLCAEEMDLTDQQLKPCKCGYEICVWCWHHIINMAEKDGTEGLCPACRSPYDKEKIVGMAANCERLVAEVNVDRRKAQKAKSKSSEGRKQLASVRVIQRNLVYIVGLPLNLADEDLLQQKEYFGQYGKVLKVSMSRTAAGVIQQFPNSTCSVYITYAKEDEAIRCIQSVHGFVLDGRPLKACFGTTKYCHAWLRNVPCTNPDCLYLHEIGSQEDSFTKDEIISEYTRSRVQQIIGATNNSLRRSGSTLPPPLDDYCNSTVASVKTLVKSSTIAAGNAVAVRANSPPSGNSGRSPALPSAAAWGMRASSQPQMASSASSDISIKPKTETASGTLNPSSAFGCDLLNEMENKVILESENKVRSSKGRPDLLKSGKEEKGEFRATPVDEPVKNGPASNVNSSYPSGLPASISNDWCSNIAPSAEDSFSHTGQSCSVGKEGVSADERKIQNLCSDFSSVRADTDARTELSGNFCTSSSLSRNDNSKSPASQLLQQTFVEEFVEPINSTANNSVAAVVNGVCALSGQGDMQRTIQNQIDRKAVFELEDEIRSFDNQRLRDPEVVTHGSHHLHSSSFHDIGRSVSNSFQHTDSFGSTDVNHDPLLVDNRFGRQSSDASCNSLASNGFLGKLTDSSYGLVRNSDNSFLPQKEEANSLGILQGDIDGRAAADAGESRIVSSILSLDIDTWDDSLSSPQDLVRLLRENDKQPSFKMPSPWKLQNSNQSRFSFARQEESRNQSSDIDTSYSSFGQLSKNHSFGQDLVETRNSLLDNLGLSNGYSPSNHGQFETFASSPQVFLPFKSNVVPRAQVSAPPGFHPTNRTPPPGFSSQERFDQTFDSLSGNRLLDSSLLRNSYQVQGSNSSNSGDIEFMDPAILAVGKGRIQGSLSNTVGLDERSNFRQPMSSVENDPRLQLLMQRSLSSHQNIRYSDNRDNLSTIDDPYSIPSRFVEQSQLNNNPSPFTQLSVQQSRNALFSNGHWNGWNEVQGANTLNMAELLRNDGLSGLNKFYGSGYQDSKFQMPSSGNFYNRPFEM